MNPAELWARLKLLEYAVKSALPGAAARAEEYRESVRAKTLETDYGPIMVVRPKQAAFIADQDGFLAWVRENRPDEIVESVRSSFTDAFLAGLRMDDEGRCFDANGERVEFAGARAGRPYLRSVLDAGMKQAAADLIVQQVESWAIPEVGRD